MDYGPLLGGASDRGTIGGMLAANLSGPRRITAGAARDHFLGFTAVSGRGETFKAGGRVVKNVTGYDLCKLMAGSCGTLAALTTVTIKVLPRPETQATVLVLGLDDATAVRAMTAALATSCDVSGAAHLPAAVAARIPLGEAVGAGRSVTLLRLEGVAPSVTHRQAALLAAMQPFGESAGQRRRGLAQRLARHPRRDAVRGDARRRRPAAVAGRDRARQGRRARACDRRAADAEVLYDWAGGLLWIMLAVRPRTPAPRSSGARWRPAAGRRR